MEKYATFYNGHLTKFVILKNPRNVDDDVEVSGYFSKGRKIIDVFHTKFEDNKEKIIKWVRFEENGDITDLTNTIFNTQR